MKNPIARTALHAAGGASGALRLILLVALLALLAATVENFLSIRNGYALLQSFALLGLVTLGLALTMLVGQFDLRQWIIFLGSAILELHILRARMNHRPAIELMLTSR